MPFDFDSDDERRCWLTFCHWLGSGRQNGTRRQIQSVLVRWFSDSEDLAKRNEELTAKVAAQQDYATRLEDQLARADAKARGA